MQRTALIFSLLFTGCLSFHSLQDGRVLDPGESSLTYGASQTTLPKDLAPQIDTDEGGAMATTHLKYRRGFSSWELGVSVLGAFAYDLASKWSLIDADHWALSIGAQMGAADYQKAFGASQKARTLQFSVPAFISYDVSPHFTA